MPRARSAWIGALTNAGATAQTRICSCAAQPTRSTVTTFITEGLVLRGIAIIAAAFSAFFLFYTVRLFAVTSFLQRTRPGGGGAYVGVVVFPLLTLAFGWASYRAWSRSAESSRGNLSNER